MRYLFTILMTIFVASTAAHANTDKINCVLVKTKNPQQYGLVAPSIKDHIDFPASTNPLDKEVLFHGYKVRVWTNNNGTLKQVGIKDVTTGFYAQSDDGWLRAEDTKKELGVSLANDEDFVSFSCSTTGFDFNRD